MKQGRVAVNGEPATEMGTKVDPERDVVELDGRVVELAPPIWIVLHKPPGYVSTRKDPRGRPTLYDLIPEEHHGLFYVGRLDRDSEGLVLLTNQGDTANRMMHPRYGVEREYVVDVEGAVGREAIDRLRRGVDLEDGPASARAVERLDGPDRDGSRLRVTMTEGRKREVRRMLDAVGHPVRRLVRTRYGPVRLGSLEPGAWRVLSDEERDGLPGGSDAAEREQRE